MNALILVDIQNDFLPGGALAVPDGDAVVAKANDLMPGFDLVVATQDWHPADHGSFAANHEGRNPGEIIDLNGLDQVLWPTHCVQESSGADFAPELRIDLIDRVFQKGTDVTVDSYSGFFDNGHRNSTGLTDYLRDAGVTKVTLIGLATDYCVKFTALDAVNEGFGTTLIPDACRGVNLKSGDVEASIEDMRSAGVQIQAGKDAETEPIRFYSTKDAYGEFSNFKAAPFVLKKKKWRTPEHYFQAQKFAGTEHEEQLRKMPSPMQVARAGRSRKRPLRKDWESVKDQIMRDAVRAKFEQNDDLKRLLLGTGDRKIIEHTTNDSYWGDGGDGSGKNMLGRILMELRIEFRKAFGNE